MLDEDYQTVLDLKNGTILTGLMNQLKLYNTSDLSLDKHVDHTNGLLYIGKLIDMNTAYLSFTKGIARFNIKNKTLGPVLKFQSIVRTIQELPFDCFLAG